MGSFPIAPPVGGFGCNNIASPQSRRGSYTGGTAIRRGGGGGRCSAGRWDSSSLAFTIPRRSCGAYLPYTPSGVPAFPPCYCPLLLSRPGKAGDLEVIPPNLSCLGQVSS